MTHELYKKHRPRNLDEVVGNKTTVAALRRMLEAEELPHTVLLSGPSGCGKTTLARILGKAVGCRGSDLIEMNCSSNRGIDTVRSIMDKMKYSPHGEARAWVLDEAHQFSRDAQHAMLKMLEDTPDHVYFFLCTTHPQKLTPTIRNRCTKMPVAPLAHQQMKSLLKHVAGEEDINLRGPVLLEILDACEGSPRAALVILDRIRHLPKPKCADVRSIAEEENAAIDLCRALFDRKRNWRKVASILKNLKADPEAVRWSVLGYAKSVLLGSGSTHAYEVLRAFEENFYDSKQAGLVRACYEAMHKAG
jgi:DNA polymerase III gamma/tau subunit